MKHLKHFALTMLLALVGNLSASAYDFEVDGFYYNVISLHDLTCEVTFGESEYNTYSSDVTIPSSVSFNGKTFTVTAIGDRAFNGCESLTSVVIPNTVTSIGNHAFGVSYNMTSVEIPNSVTEIKSGAFGYCSSLTSLEIPNSVTTIEGNAFQYCRSLISLEIPNSVTTIEAYAFGNCSSLTSLVIGNSVNTIGHYAFAECSNLTSVVIGMSASRISYNVFNGCTNLNEIISLNTTPPDVENINTFEGVSKTTCVLKVPSESVEAYKVADVWNIFWNIVPYDDSEEGGEFEIADCEKYSEKKTRNNMNITYTREFTNTNWQALYVPFELDVVEDLGDGFEVAEINGVHQFDTDNDGALDETWMEFRTVKSGTLKANTPYVIRPASTGKVTLNLKNRTLYAASKGTVKCSTSRHLYTLTGTYTEISDIEGKYAMKGGEFRPGTPGVNTIKPQRIYLTISTYDGGYGTALPAAAPARVRVMVDGQATGIEVVQSPEFNVQSPAYNLQGVRVGADYKGIVIQNGKKVLKR